MLEHPEHSKNTNNQQVYQDISQLCQNSNIFGILHALDTYFQKAGTTLCFHKWYVSVHYDIVFQRQKSCILL